MQDLRAWDPPTVGGYELVGLLGVGGMGEVFLGRDGAGRLAAVKIVHDAFARDGEFRARFAREVATARKVHGPWTAAVIDADTDAPRPWLATEYVEGPSLRDHVAENGPLPEPVVSVLAARLAEALVAIHGAGLVHRDLTPANVLLAADGPRVIDFGIARAMEATKLTLTGQAIGTPAYMAPEQLGDDELGSAADVFTLGSLLYFAATGRGPFDDTSVVATLRKVVAADPDLSVLPPGLRDLIGRCMAKSPSARPAATELVSAPASSWSPPASATLVLDHSSRPNNGTLIAPPPSPPPVPPKRKRRRYLVLAAAAVVAVAGTGMVAAISGSLSAPPPPIASAAPPAPTSAPPVERIGFVPAVTPGWMGTASLLRNVAYDVPPSWELLPAGSNFFTNRTQINGVAQYMKGACGDPYGERGFAGVAGSSDANLTAVASDTARLWADGHYTYTADGLAPQVRVDGGVPITVHGMTGVHVTARVVVNTGQNACRSSRAVIHTVAVPGTGGGTVVWVLVADQGVDDAAPEADIAQMIGTVRRAGIDCSTPVTVGTLC